MRFPMAMAVLLMTSLAAAAGDEEFLPTPYTAAQIRDEWQVGLVMVTHDTTPEGETWTRMTVREWSPEAVTFGVLSLDERLEPAGEERLASSTWAEIQDHARFPAARAQRTRANRETALGELAGWFYEVTGEDGGNSEYFFADSYPGPPVIYSQSLDGETLLHSAMIERR